MSTTLTPATFRPIFQTDVTVTIPGGAKQGVNPHHCLSETSAKEFAAILNANGYPCKLVRDADGAVCGHPITYAGGIVKDAQGQWIWNGKGAAPSTQVPHFVFADNPKGGDGTICNAGLVTQYYVNNPPNPGDTHIVAWNRALEEIAGERKNQLGVD